VTAELDLGGQLAFPAAPEPALGSFATSAYVPIGALGCDILTGVRVSDAREIVELAHVDPDYYSLDGSWHDGLCLLASGQTWLVFVFERGGRHEEQSFATEDEACVYFLKRLFQLWQPR